jgi:SAM-dependent methyltransferase
VPKLLRTLIPRIKRSFAERGVIQSLLRAPTLPFHILREQRIARKLARESERSDFDVRYGVDTDGDIGGGKSNLRGRTFLSDLNIPSPNWIYGKDYSPISPERFNKTLSSLQIEFDDLAFVDFGSGKGRALLLASEFPFKKIIGVEFSPELHSVAQANLLKYSSSTQACKKLESICMDFVDFQLPEDACLLYFLDPCREKVHAKILQNVLRSWREHPRRIYILYLSPLHKGVFDSSPFLRKLASNDETWFSFYEVVGN